MNLKDDKVIKFKLGIAQLICVRMPFYTVLVAAADQEDDGGCCPPPTPARAPASRAFLLGNRR